MDQGVFAPPVASLIHTAQIYDFAVAQCGEPLDLQRIQWPLAGVRAGCKYGRQKKQVGPCAIRPMDFPGMMDRRAVQQARRGSAPLATAMNAIGAPTFGECCGSRQKDQMTMPPSQPLDIIKPCSSNILWQMIMAKDYSAMARQLNDRIVQPGIIAFVGEQPDPGQHCILRRR